MGVYMTNGIKNTTMNPQWVLVYNIDQFILGEFHPYKTSTCSSLETFFTEKAYKSRLQKLNIEPALDETERINNGISSI